MGYPLPIVRYLTEQSHLIHKKKVLTLGNLYPSGGQSRRRARLFPELTKYESTQFSSGFLRDYLKASSLQVLDVDPYQGADVIANLNKKVDPKLVGEFDTILDFGTLEHLSNLSMALTNIFSLLKQHGSYCFLLPANNWIDHGFFQFSPTFFIDLISQNQGLVGHDLFYACNQQLIHFSQCDHYVRRVLAHSQSPIFVGGVIEKISSDLSLDLVQSKYSDSYVSRDSTIKVPSQQKEIGFPKETKKTQIGRSMISKAPILPNSVKLRLLTDTLRYAPSTC